MAGLLTAVDLSDLSPPQVLEELDYESILDQITADYRERYPDFTAVLESDPVIKLLEAYAYREMLLRQRVNDGAKAVLLAKAVGADLDQIAAQFGVVRASGEDDARFRQRTALALEAFSVAGPVGAYRFFALTAAPEVKSVSVTSPAPGQVIVTLLGKEGDGTLGGGVVQKVQDALNADDVRPLTDVVSVESAEIIEYTVNAGLTILPGPSSDPILDRARKAVEDYVARRHNPGQDISKSGLHAALHVEGVQRVDLRSPATLPINVGPRQAAYATNITVTLDGRSE